MTPIPSIKQSQTKLNHSFLSPRCPHTQDLSCYCFKFYSLKELALLPFKICYSAVPICFRPTKLLHQMLLTQEAVRGPSEHFQVHGQHFQVANALRFGILLTRRALLIEILPRQIEIGKPFIRCKFSNHLIGWLCPQ